MVKVTTLREHFDCTPYYWQRTINALRDELGIPPSVKRIRYLTNKQVAMLEERIGLPPWKRTPAAEPPKPAPTLPSLEGMFTRVNPAFGKPE